MAKVENSKIQVSLDNDSKRIIRNLTKAIDRLTRNVRPYEVRGAVRRLAEPADDSALSDDNENYSQDETPKFASGGYVSANTTPEPDRGHYVHESRFELDDRTINALRAAAGRYSALR